MNQKNLKRILCLALGMVMSLGFAFAQGGKAKAISGVVKDASGEPLIGVSVQVKGTQTGVVTNIDGEFSIAKAEEGKTLVLSYVGYNNKEVRISSQNKYSITMEENTKGLEEVVVIGYGTQKRKDLTGSVVSVGSEALSVVPVSTAAEALQGKMAGVQITTTEGSPDAEMKIRVRGGGSITQSNEPLYIVDGFPVNSISDIPPTDIETIDVLKDASSTAIYGSRGANGVIIITTKGGKAGKVNVSYNAYISTKKLVKKIKTLSPKDYASWQYELALLDSNDRGLTPNPEQYTDYFGTWEDMSQYDGMKSIDWQDEVFGRTGSTMNHNLSITGGSETVKYAFSYNHIDDKAIMRMSSFKRDNLSLKLNAKPNKRITLDFSARYAKTRVKGSGMNEQSTTSSSDARLKHAVIYTPFLVPGLTDGVNAGETDPSFNLYNPMESIRDFDKRTTRRVWNVAGSLAWEVIDNLRLKTEFGFDSYQNDGSRYYGLSTYYVKNTPASENKEKPAVTFTDTNRESFRNTNTASYDFQKILGKDSDHHLNLMLGEEYIITKENVFTNTIHGFPKSYTADQCFKLSNNGVPFEIKKFYNPDDIMLSFFGRVNYDYQSKYLFSATFRADGSSKFGKGNQWGYFPSAAVAWRISSEKFMESTKSWLDDLKLRLSFGTAGNNNIPAGSINPAWQVNTTAWIDGFTTYWAPSKVMANPNLKWETTTTRNIGLDFTMLSGRLSGSLEAYLNDTKDLLIQFPVAGTGYDTQYRNMGKTQNKGFEFSLNYVALDKQNYGLQFNANISFNKNKIKSLGMMNDFGAETGWGSTAIGQDYRVAVNGQVGQMYGFRNAGRYEVSDFEGYNATTKEWILKEGVDDGSAILGTIRPGTMKLRDLTDDGKVSMDDREVIGNANPTHTGGFGINGRLYGFDLTANFNWSVGNDIYNANKIEYTTSGGSKYRNMMNKMEAGRRWTNLNADGTICNDPATLAQLNENTTMWSPYMKQFVFSDWAVEDGSFLRLSTLSLGYSLPKSILSKVGIDRLRFYVTAYNLFCITGYSGPDPEVSTRRQTELTPGVDYSAYPKSRSFVFGLNLNF